MSVICKEYIMNLAEERYGVSPEYLWKDYPYAVLRHTDNKKWFAVFMNIPADKLGLEDGGEKDILDVKCDPLITGSLIKKDGYLPAYHMNKVHWITILLDGTVPEEEITDMLDRSYDLTKRKIRVKKEHKNE